jgi:phage-related protein
VFAGKRGLTTGIGLPLADRVIGTKSSAAWRLIYRVDPDAIVIAEVFAKKTEKTPKEVMQACKRRLKEYDNA